MSLILDALRKSEAERRRGQSPSLYAHTPVPARRRGLPVAQLLPIASGVLLLLIALVLWFRHDDAPVTKDELVEESQPSLVPPVPEPGGAPVAPPPPAAKPPPLPATPAPRALAPGEAPNTAAAATAPGVDALVQPSVGVPASAAQAPEKIVAAPGAAPAPASAASADTPADDVPPMSVLDPTTRGGLPPLKLSMMSYNIDSSRRFAIIDGQRVGEGSQLGNAIVLSIRRDGVVLDVAGKRVLLPRP